MRNWTPEKHQHARSLCAPKGLLPEALDEIERLRGLLIYLKTKFDRDGENATPAVRDMLDEELK